MIGKQNAAHVSLQELSTRFAASRPLRRADQHRQGTSTANITHTGKFKQITGEDTVRMDVKNAKPFKGQGLGGSGLQRQPDSDLCRYVPAISVAGRWWSF